MAHNRKKATGAAGPKSKPGAAPAAKPIPVRINPANLTEDDADYLHYLKHKGEERHSAEEVLNEAGYELER